MHEQPDQVKIPFQELVFRDIRIRGSLICSPEEGRQMLQVVAKHGISVKTNPFNGLEEIEKVIHLAEGGKMKGKGIVIMDPEQIKKEQESGLDMV
jgi:propanol-preferring alcohol dehydrogenase